MTHQQLNYPRLKARGSQTMVDLTRPKIPLPCGDGRSGGVDHKPFHPHPNLPLKGKEAQDFTFIAKRTSPEGEDFNILKGTIILKLATWAVELLEGVRMIGEASLANIVGVNNVSHEEPFWKILQRYKLCSCHQTRLCGQTRKCRKILRLSTWQGYRTPLVPVSSVLRIFKGDTVPGMVGIIVISVAWKRLSTSIARTGWPCLSQASPSVSLRQP